MAAQRRPVAHQPFVPERVDEAALPVRSPRHLMVPDTGETALGARLQSASDQRIRVVAEHLHSGRRCTELRRSLPAVLLRLTEEYWRTVDLHSHDRPEVPELRRTKRSLVPRERCRSIGNCEHHGYHRPASRRHNDLQSARSATRVTETKCAYLHLCSVGGCPKGPTARYAVRPLTHASGRRDSNPRPPEPHSSQGELQKRQVVGSSKGSEHRCQNSLASKPGFAGRNGPPNGPRS